MFLSQFLDVKKRGWKKKSCGIVALKIVLHYWLGENFNVPLDELINLGLKKDAYLKNVGWKHKELAEIAKDFKLNAKNFDWYSLNNKEAFKKFLNFLKRGPVIVSVYKNFHPQNNGHLVVAISEDKKYIYILDPGVKKRKGIFQKISFKKFKNGWKKRIIFIHPKLIKN